LQTPLKLRYTIGQLMALIAAFACVLALPIVMAHATAADVAFMTCVLALPGIFLVLNFLIELVFGIQCPACSRWTLKRLARSRRYYQCPSCGARVKRSGFGLGVWRNASGPEHDAKYQPKTRERRWGGFAVPENPGDTTSGLLLHNKRVRHPGDVEADDDALDPNTGPHSPVRS
jgi:hypothetical protein